MKKKKRFKNAPVEFDQKKKEKERKRKKERLIEGFIYKAENVKEKREEEKKKKRIVTSIKKRKIKEPKK